MLVKAYQYGTFSKIQEFIEFRRRLDTSLQHAISRAEIMRLDYIHSSFQTKYAVQFFQEQDVSEIAYNYAFIEARSDNRDFNVFLNCNAQDKPTTEEKCKPCASTNTVWVQVVSYILNILSIVSETKESGRNLAAVVDEFKALLERENIKEKITEQEYWLARYVADLSNALVLMKASKDAIPALKSATDILDNQGKMSNGLCLECMLTSYPWHSYKSGCFQWRDSFLEYIPSAIKLFGGNGLHACEYKPNMLTLVIIGI